MTTDPIVSQLFALQDLKYKEFNAGLLPESNPDDMIGVSITSLRKFAKNIIAEEPEACELFIQELPHRYFEENNLHALILESTKDFNLLMSQIERFLPFIDNWQTCDIFSPKLFKKNTKPLFDFIQGWLKSDHCYTVRYGIINLMRHFLDEKFRPDHFKLLSRLDSDEYYVNMAIAWYFATAIAKHPEQAVAFMEEKHLSAWTHNKAIQKAVESRRVSADVKECLKSFKIK